MKNFVKIIITVTIGVIILSGCQSKTNERIDIKLKSEEEQIEIHNNYTYDDYKRIFDDAMIEAENFETEDIVLKKWIIRTLAAEKLYYETDLTDDEVLKLSIEAMEENIAWKEIARGKYGVTVSENEIDTYIQKLPDIKDLPKTLAYADALGLTLEELNSNFDRDIYEKNVIWLKLIPKLEEEYDTDDNNLLVQRYKEEVVESLYR